jgi:hypothetical protein
MDQTTSQAASQTACYKIHFKMRSTSNHQYKPFELVFAIFDIICFIVIEKIDNSANQFIIDAVHVARRGHNCTHITMTKLDAFLNLGIHKLSNKRLRTQDEPHLPKCPS